MEYSACIASEALKIIMHGRIVQLHLCFVIYHSVREKKLHVYASMKIGSGNFPSVFQFIALSLHVDIIVCVLLKRVLLF